MTHDDFNLVPRTVSTGSRVTCRIAHGHIHIARKKKTKYENHVSEHEIIFVFLIFHLNGHIILYMSLNIVVS